MSAAAYLCEVRVERFRKRFHAIDRCEDIRVARHYQPGGAGVVECKIDLAIRNLKCDLRTGGNHRANCGLALKRIRIGNKFERNSTSRGLEQAPAPPCEFRSKAANERRFEPGNQRGVRDGCFYPWIPGQFE